MMSDNDILEQVRAVFYEEQLEHCQSMASLLVTLEAEQEPEQRQRIMRQMFRESHGLKGGARAAQFSEIEQIAHALEELFSQAQQNHMIIPPTLISVFQQAIIAIAVLAEYYATKQAITEDLYLPILQQLHEILKPDPSSLNSQKPPETPHPIPTPPLIDTAEPEEFAGFQKSKERIRVALPLLDTIMQQAGELQAYIGQIHNQMRQGNSLEQYFARWQRLWHAAQPAMSILKSLSQEHDPVVHYLTSSQTSKVPSSIEYADQQYALRSIYSSLQSMNQFMFEFKNHARLASQHFHERHNVLNSLSQRLFQEVRRTRMQKMAVLFQPLVLHVQHLALATNKLVHLHVEGDEIEADTQVLEQLHEVLLHLIRNAIDHGIESPEQRMNLGKSEFGNIYISATTQGERLIIELCDDGAGLDEDAIRQKAIDTFGITHEEWQQLDLSSRLSFIFRSGFSTRNTVDTLSGRGVGLDIVRMQIERMQGVIEVEHIPQNGCLFRMILPLSLSNLDAFLVRVGRTMFGISFHAVLQIIMVQPSDLIDQQPYTVIHVSDRHYPVVMLSDWLELDNSHQEPVQRWFGLLIGSADRQVVCLVEDVIGQQELMVQRLPFPYHTTYAITGASILADGTIVPIFNIADILQHPYQQFPHIKEPVPSKADRSVLIVDDSHTTRTLVRLILEDAGYQVRSANDGMEASHLLSQEGDAPAYDIVISDIDMPHMNGFELTSWIRTQITTRHIPVILLSSLSDSNDYKRGIAVGADAYIVKHEFDQHTLLQTINRLI